MMERSLVDADLAAFPLVAASFHQVQDVTLEAGEECLFAGFQKELPAFFDHFVDKVEEIAAQCAHAGQEAVAGFKMEIFGGYGRYQRGR